MSAGIDRDAADTLMNDYVERLDGDRLEDWLELFTEDCSYRILPRENVDLGMPAPIMLCTNKNMLRDRVTALRTANEYNLHYGRHLVSNLRLKPDGEGACRVEASFAVYQTNLEGQTRLFSVGRYQDRARLEGGRLLFCEKLVVIDTFSVPSLLAIPL